MSPVAARATVATDMRAAILSAPGQVTLQRVPRRRPGPEEVLVRIEGCGVCGSHLPLWEGRPWFQYPCAPGAPGHEGWGAVAEVGGEVRGVHAGQRVTLLSYQAFAEYDLAPADHVVPLPESLSGLPFPGESLACAMNVFARSRIEAGQQVAVIGVGFLGTQLVRLASRAGARVIAVSRRPFALEAAHACGASETVAFGDPAQVVRSVLELTEGRGCERVIEVVGHQEALDVAGAVAAERGRVVIAGYHQDGPRRVDLQLWNWRGLDVINAHERDPRLVVDGMRRAIEAVVAGVLDPAPLYTHAFPLADLPGALEALRTRPARFMKALVLA
jgi:threonine dehydrogenase-like Zn-dependent dehydrogenase